MNIVVENVTKSYRKSVLKDISLNIDKPGVYLIAGPNGSGKTTLLETIVGLRQSDSGTIRLKQKRISVFFSSKMVYARRSS
nr:ATP-binding cassette domain-containing protein [Streptococcus gallolyticus]